MELTKQVIEISSMKDIIDKVPIDCIDSFLIDLRSRIELTHKCNVLKKLLPDGMIEHDDTTIQWVNDRKNEANIQIEIK